MTSLLHEGCAVCRSQGVHVSLVACYEDRRWSIRDLREGARQPYLNVMSLGEGDTPLRESARLSRWVGVRRLSVKDESRNPTGSHKDRMSALGVTQALDMGATGVVLASSGNAAVSAARYARAAGLACDVATYASIDPRHADEIDREGAVRHPFDDNAGRWAFVHERASRPDVMALTNHHLPALGSAPLAIEGYKRIAYECQAQGTVPDHVVVPTARGDLAWGLHAGFREVEAAGGDAAPRLWVVEPFGRLVEVLAGADLHASFPGRTAQFSSAGATVTYLQWWAATDSGGGAIVVGDDPARAAARVAADAGHPSELCAAAALAAARDLSRDGRIEPDSHVLWLLTAAADRDPAQLPPTQSPTRSP